MAILPQLDLSDRLDLLRITALKYALRLLKTAPARIFYIHFILTGLTFIFTIAFINPAITKTPIIAIVIVWAASYSAALTFLSITKLITQFQPNP